MADGGTGEKTEEPTPERLRKLKEEGNVPKSQDVPKAISFIAVFVALALMYPYVQDEWVQYYRFVVRLASMEEHEPVAQISAALYQGLILLLKSTVPFLVIEMIMAVTGNAMQFGFIFTTKPLTPDFKKINPVNGLKGMFKLKKLVELIKTIIKFSLISYLAYYALSQSLRDVIMIIRINVQPGAAVEDSSMMNAVIVGLEIVGAIVWDFGIKTAVLFLFIAAFDAWYQHWQYKKDNMMSKYDVKQEYKQQEGDPQIKSERRRLHQELLNSAAPSNVKKSNVVVTNPEHIAVALRYDEETEGAPEVVAKGTRLWAEKIKELAREYGIPIVRNVPLAHALNKVNVGHEIPEELYEAVAEVLHFVAELAGQPADAVHELPSADPKGVK